MLFPNSLVKAGDPYTPLKTLYPEYKWVNLTCKDSQLGGLAILSPAQVQHPFSSVIGITYYMISALVIANKLANLSDWRTLAQSNNKLVQVDAPVSPANSRRPIRSLLKFILFERYVTDFNFHAAIVKVAASGIYLDTYIDGKVPTATYFSSLYPPIINGLLDYHKDGSDAALAEYLRMDLNWYLRYLEESEVDEFLEGYRNLVQTLDNLKKQEVVGRYWAGGSR